MRIYQQVKTHNFITHAEFTAMYNAAPTGGVLDMGGAIAVSEGVRFVVTKDLTLTNGGFRRGNTPTAITTAPINIGDYTVTVDDPTGFSVGNVINVSYGLARDENSGVSGTINDITGNVITTNQQHIRAVPTGGIVFWEHELFALTGGKLITFDEFSFDGNKANNNYTNDWQYNHTGTITGLGQNVLNCEIKDTPCENFFIRQGTHINYNKFHNLNGSFIHVSNFGTVTLEHEVIGNVGDGVCSVPDTINGHDEGAFTFSSFTQFMKIEDNIVKNGGESCYGRMGAEDFNVNVKNNHWTNFKSKVFSGILDTSLDTFVNVPNGT